MKSHMNILKLMCWIAILLAAISCSGTYSEKEVLSYGVLKKVTSNDNLAVSQPIWLFSEADLNSSIKDSLYSPLNIVILESTASHYLIANDSLNVKGYILKGYVELDCNRLPNICNE